jgi:hypothetical protein
MNWTFSIHQTSILGWWMLTLARHYTNMQSLSLTTRLSTQILVPLPTAHTWDTFYATLSLYQRAVGWSKGSMELRLTFSRTEILSTRQQSTVRSMSASSGEYFTPRIPEST